jgi:hypothetical protein
MRRYKFLRFLAIIPIAILGIFLFGYIIMQLWNWLAPAIFGFHTITYWQALGLFLLCKLLFGGFHRHGGRGGRGWRQHMEDRWEKMSPEEREKFRAGMRGRRGCRPFESAAEPEAR